MKPVFITGLGEPEPMGKKALFQPPLTGSEKSKSGQRRKEDISNIQKPPGRVRTTIELTNHALAIIQDIQHRHRLETGKVLPLWILVSNAIESYGESKHVENHEDKNIEI